MKRVARIGGAAVLAAALFVAGGIGLFRSRRRMVPRAQAGAPRPRRTPCSRPRSAGRSSRSIENLQSRLRGAADGLAGVRITRASPTSSRRASRPTPATTRRLRACCERSLGLERNDNFAAMVGMAALAAARHDFAGALRWGEQAKAINPYNGNVYGVIGDAQVELGRYRGRVRDVPEDGRHAAGRGVVRPRLVRARADGRRARRDQGDGGGARHRGDAGGLRLGGLSAGRAVLQSRATSTTRTLPTLAASRPMRTTSRRSRGSRRWRGRAGTCGRPSPATPMSSRGTPRPNT